MKYLNENNDNIYAEKIKKLENFLYENEIVISSANDMYITIHDKEFVLERDASCLPRVFDHDRFKIVEEINNENI